MTKQEQSLNEWLNSYKERIFRYNEPQRIAHRKEIESYLKEIGNKFNLR
jgi:hypothetical protein